MTTPTGTDQQPPLTPHRLHPVSLPGFAGPLDLLLSLIEEEKLDISGISLAAVTAQYLERIRALENASPEHLADFLLVAATLLLLKSRRLFPDLELTGEEEERIAGLEDQLREYRRFRAAAKQLLALWGAGRLLAARGGYLHVAAVFTPPPDISGASLRASMGTVVDHLPRLEILAAEVVKRVISIEERIRVIQQRITERASLSFQEVTREAKDRLEVIVSFLALLELVKQRVVAAEQGAAFRDILLRRQADATENPELETPAT